MIITTLELRFYIDSKGEYLTVGRYFFNPNFEIGKEMEVYWPKTNDQLYTTGEYYQIKVKVVDSKTEIYGCDDRQLIDKAKDNFNLNNSVEQLMNTGIINVRVFVEAEDRSLMVKISEQIQKNQSRF